MRFEEALREAITEARRAAQTMEFDDLRHARSWFLGYVWEQIDAKLAHEHIHGQMPDHPQTYTINRADAVFRSSVAKRVRIQQDPAEFFEKMGEFWDGGGSSEEP